MERCLCNSLAVNDGDMVLSVSTCPRCCRTAVQMLTRALLQMDLFEEGESVSVSALPDLRTPETTDGEIEIVTLDDLPF